MTRRFPVGRKYREEKHRNTSYDLRNHSQTNDDVAEDEEFPIDAFESLKTTKFPHKEDIMKLSHVFSWTTVSFVSSHFRTATRLMYIIGGAIGYCYLPNRYRRHNFFTDNILVHTWSKGPIYRSHAPHSFSPNERPQKCNIRYRIAYKETKST